MNSPAQIKASKLIVGHHPEVYDSIIAKSHLDRHFKGCLPQKWSTPELPFLRKQPKPNRLRSAWEKFLSVPADMQFGKRQMRERKEEEEEFSTKSAGKRKRFAASELHVEFQPQVWPCKRLSLRPRGDVTERQALKVVRPCEFEKMRLEDRHDSPTKGSPSREKGKKRSSLPRSGQVGKHHCSSVYRLCAENFFYDVLYMSGSCGCQLIMHEVLAAIRNRFMLK